VFVVEETVIVLNAPRRLFGEMIVLGEIMFNAL